MNIEDAYGYGDYEECQRNPSDFANTFGITDAISAKNSCLIRNNRRKIFKLIVSYKRLKQFRLDYLNDNKLSKKYYDLYIDVLNNYDIECFVLPTYESIDSLLNSMKYQIEIARRFYIDKANRLRDETKQNNMNINLSRDNGLLMFQ